MNDVNTQLKDNQNSDIFRQAIGENKLFDLQQAIGNFKKTTNKFDRNNDQPRDTLSSKKDFNGNKKMATLIKQKSKNYSKKG